MSRGFIREGSPTYLWDGEIIEPMAENQPNFNAVANLLRLLISRLPENDWTVNQNAPVELMEGFKPQPDLSVLRGPREDYETHVATAGDVGLLIDVADTSRLKDAGVFLRKYAEARIEAYWIVNILERRVEVYSEPLDAANQPAGYSRVALYGVDDLVPLSTCIKGIASVFGDLAVRDVLRNSLGPKSKEAIS